MAELRDRANVSAVREYQDDDPVERVFRSFLKLDEDEKVQLRTRIFRHRQPQDHVAALAGGAPSLGAITFCVTSHERGLFKCSRSKVSLSINSPSGPSIT